MRVAGSGSGRIASVCTRNTQTEETGCFEAVSSSPPCLLRNLWLEWIHRLHGKFAKSQMVLSIAISSPWASFVTSSTP